MYMTIRGGQKTFFLKGSAATLEAKHIWVGANKKNGANEKGR